MSIQDWTAGGRGLCDSSEKEQEVVMGEKREEDRGRERKGEEGGEREREFELH